jgi:hypothetical protein
MRTPCFRLLPVQFNDLRPPAVFEFLSARDAHSRGIAIALIDLDGVHPILDE